MADKKLSSVSAVSDASFVYAETSTGETVKISKANLASVVGGLLSSKFVNLGSSANNSQSLASISPIGQCGLILLNANVNYASESNQHSSLWLYMNTVSWTNAGYTTTGVSVQKIASLKHDYGSAITDCALVGSTTSESITVSKGSFNTFSYLMIPLG